MKKPTKKKNKYIIAAAILLAIYVICNVMCICLYSNIDNTQKCDVGIVLGAATDNTSVSEVYKQRLNHAIALYKNQTIDFIIVTWAKQQIKKIRIVIWQINIC